MPIKAKRGLEARQTAHDTSRLHRERTANIMMHPPINSMAANAANRVPVVIKVACPFRARQLLSPPEVTPGVLVFFSSEADCRLDAQKRIPETHNHRA